MEKGQETHSLSISAVKPGGVDQYHDGETALRPEREKKCGKKHVAVQKKKEKKMRIGSSRGGEVRKGSENKKTLTHR